jgi:GT2 family glycosyltransferase
VGSLDISAVIVSYNSEKFLGKNLKSLISQSIKFRKIIVVDNDSKDSSTEIIKMYSNKTPELRPIILDHNSGYSRGANIGIKETDSEIILVANSDIFLHQDFNGLVLKKFKEDRTLDILGPLILRFDQKTVDSAGQSYSLALYPSEIGFNKPLNKTPMVEKPTFSVCGAATVFRRSALEELEVEKEYYDEDYFMFWEDFDIGWRAHLFGLKTLFYPDAVVYHYRSGTLKKNFFSRFSLSMARSAVIKYHLIKNRYLTLIKNFRFRQFYWAIPFILLKDLIWVSLLTISSPKIIMDLLRSGTFLKKALKKRLLLKYRENLKKVKKKDE